MDSIPTVAHDKVDYMGLHLFSKSTYSTTKHPNQCYALIDETNVNQQHVTELNHYT